LQRAIKKYTIIYTILFVTFIIVNFLGTDSTRKIFIDGDGSGHYAYLTSIVLYQSVDFVNIFELEKSKRPNDYMGHYFHKYNDILINKYTTGTALLQLPFFILAYVLSIILGFAPDGYNIVFQYCIAFATVFWVGIGIRYFVKLVSSYGIDKRYGWLFASIMLFGTNLFLYTFIQPSFSHGYSFAIITIFLYCVRKLFLKCNRKYLLLSSFLFGLIFLIRPANALIVTALPFIAGSPAAMINVLRLKFRNNNYLLAIIVFLFAISPQLIINYIQTGTPIIYGYKNEGFYFSNPQIINFLASYRKGWFVYTPLFLLLIPSVFYLWRKKSKYLFFTFIAFLTILVYVYSSWWNWYYGDSFGMRPMVDFYGLFMLVLSMFLFNIKSNALKKLAYIFVAFVVLLNLFQSYQYAVGIIHPDSMSEKSYWHVFMKIDKKFKNVISGGDESYYGTLDDSPFFSTYNNIENPDSGWTIPPGIVDENSCSGSLAVMQTPQIIFSPSYTFTIPDSIIGMKNIFVRFNVAFVEPEANSALRTAFIVDITDTSGTNVFYKAFRIKPLPNNDINICQYGNIGFKLPEIKPDMDYLKFYVWNIEKQTYYLDDISLEFYTYN
jgi:hypothetical protein